MEQTRDQLVQHLKDHIAFLISSSDAYDQGYEAEAKRLAVTLRLIFHSSRTCTPLAHQLPELAAMRMYDTADSLDLGPSVLGGIWNLVAMGTARYVPWLDGKVETTADRRFSSIEEWWNKPLLQDAEGRMFTRASLVLGVADQDGGAHVDPVLRDDYAALSLHNSLKHIYAVNGSDWKDFPQPVAACIRQIAHETIVSLALCAPDCFLDSVTAELYCARTPSPHDVYHEPGMLIGGIVANIIPAEAPQSWSEAKRVGRNERCPCGSGLKYKRCCGR